MEYNIDNVKVGGHIFRYEFVTLKILVKVMSTTLIMVPLDDIYQPRRIHN